MKSLPRFLAAAAAAAVLAASAVPAGAQGARVSAGTLSCSVEPGVSFGYGSSRQVNCVYHSADGATERYVGEIDRWGADIGYTGAATMTWTVVAGTAKLPPNTLVGNYAGVSGAVTAGIGGAGNVLAGGSNRSVSLQPVSIEGNTGLNLAVGVGVLTLRRP